MWIWMVPRVFAGSLYPHPSSEGLTQGPTACQTSTLLLSCTPFYSCFLLCKWARVGQSWREKPLTEISSMDSPCSVGCRLEGFWLCSISCCMSKLSTRISTQEISSKILLRRSQEVLLVWSSAFERIYFMLGHHLWQTWRRALARMSQQVQGGGKGGKDLASPSSADFRVYSFTGGGVTLVWDGNLRDTGSLQTLHGSEDCVPWASVSVC